MADDDLTEAVPTGSKPDPKKTARKKRAGNAQVRVRPSLRFRRFMYMCLLLVIAVFGAGLVALRSVELPASTDKLDVTSFVCTAEIAHGECGPTNSVAQFSSEINRVLVDLDQISIHMQNAVVAAEDRSFYSHNGVDPWGITRALVRDLQGSASKQGGSTITQQYVKNVYLTNEQTLKRKIREAAFAIELERTLSKDEILGQYLNEIYFGRGAYGAEAAALAYFDKDAADLNIAESAYLAGLIRAPEAADAARNEDEAQRRRASVLVAMKDEGYISADEAEFATAIPWTEEFVLPRPPATNGTVVRGEFRDIEGEYIIEWARQQLVDLFGDSAVYKDGLRVYLTIDQDHQRAAHNAVQSNLGEPTDPSSSLVSIDTGGRITSMIGGQNYSESQVNLALGTDGGGSGRSPGSTFKALALAAFIEKGFSVDSEFAAPEEITVPDVLDGEDWVVHNYEDEDLGIITAEEATWKSSNTAYIQMMEDVGSPAIADMAARTGVTAPIPPNDGSIVLGTAGVSVLDMANSYSTFAGGGMRTPSYVIARVEDDSGKVLYDSQEDPDLARNRVMEPGVAATVNNVLSGVVTNGTARAAQFAKPAAGKTGTTDTYLDAWFVGYTCELTTSVWVGFENPEPMENVRGQQVTGGSFPTTIWRDFMEVATVGTSSCGFPDADFGTEVLEPDMSLIPTTTSPPAPSTTLGPNDDEPDDAADGTEGDGTETDGAGADGDTPAEPDPEPTPTPSESPPEEAAG